MQITYTNGLILCCLSLLIVGIYVYMTKADSQSSSLYQRARKNLHLYDQPLLICLINDRKAGYSTLNFIESAIRNAASPLRLRFVVVTDLTAEVEVEEYMTALIKRVGLTPTVNFVETKTRGYLNSLSKALQKIQTFEYTAAMVARPAFVRAVPDFDKYLIGQTEYPSRVLTGRSNRTFLRLKQTQHLDRTLLPVIESFKLSPTVFGISSPYQTTANAYASSYFIAFSKANCPYLGQGHGRWPDDLGPATDLFLTDLLLERNRELSTFDHLVEEVAGNIKTTRSTRSSLNMLTAFVADRKKVGRVFSKATSKRTGLNALGIPTSRRALLGLTDRAFVTNEAATKYGSVFRTQRLLKKK